MRQLRIRNRLVLTRRRLLKTVCGLLGSLTIPVWARSRQKNKQSFLREAEYYRPSEHSEKMKNQ